KLRTIRSDLWSFCLLSQLHLFPRTLAIFQIVGTLVPLCHRTVTPDRTSDSPNTCGFLYSWSLYENFVFSDSAFLFQLWCMGVVGPENPSGQATIYILPISGYSYRRNDYRRHGHDEKCDSAFEPFDG